VTILTQHKTQRYNKLDKQIFHRPSINQKQPEKKKKIEKSPFTVEQQPTDKQAEQIQDRAGNS